MLLTAAIATLKVDRSLSVLLPKMTCKFAGWLPKSQRSKAVGLGHRASLRVGVRGHGPAPLRPLPLSSETPVAGPARWPHAGVSPGRELGVAMGGHCELCPTGKQALHTVLTTCFLRSRPTLGYTHTGCFLKTPFWQHSHYVSPTSEFSCFSLDSSPKPHCDVETEVSC